MATPKKLLAVLRKHLDSLTEPYRDVERRAGLPSGTIVKLLAGEMDLRLRHIDRIGQVCGVSALSLFSEAYGPKRGVVRFSRLFTPLFGKEWERLVVTGDFDKKALNTRIKNLKVEE